MSAIALELEALVDHMDVEWREAGHVSAESSQRLKDLHLRFEALFANPGQSKPTGERR